MVFEREVLKKLFESFSSMNVLVVGDVMMDAYYRGRVDRISPEAPVPVVHVVSRDRRLGGAANVALNIKSMGATPLLCSVTGSDAAAVEFNKILTAEGMDTRGIILSKSRTTTVKTRIISGSQQLLRIDEEEIKPLEAADTDRLLLVIAELLESERVDVVIFEDYDKGTLTPDLIRGVMELAQRFEVPTAVDPKKDNFLSYSGATLFKPNLKELREGLNFEFHKTEIMVLQNEVTGLPAKLGVEKLLLTLSEHGALITDTQGGFVHTGAHLRSIADVSGAGDTVIAVAAMCLAAGCSNSQILAIANLAGGLVCEHVGVVPVSKQNLLDEALSLLVK